MASNCLDATIHATSSPALPSTIHIAIPSTMITSPLSTTDNYSARSQWLRAAILGANDGLISNSSLMLGIGALNQSSHAMLISGFAGLIAGAFSMGIGEFVSVYAQYDMESAQLKRHNKTNKESLPNPWKAAAASAIAFAFGAVLPLLVGGFIRSWVARVVVVGVVSSMGLATFGAAGAKMGGAAVGKAAGRVLVGGWIAMLATFGILRFFGLVFYVNISSGA
ncbi:hypothetical protein KFK09_028144 [Dendrobium nobile]|uniref:Vacuolar iron transporter n=1 Tax=Dendrobium nobile TaxID=94219 RepID=A0A8T3A1X7_DENNO|nr:hypothetical protein KFK09_028144 [Dendrobium nobile]